MEQALAEVREQPKPAPRVSPQAIQERKEQISLLQGMVRDLLIRGVDYGRIPSTPQDSLWDPGASQIIGAFNCFPGERRILKFEDTDEKISICVEVPIISRETNLVVTTGIGAASTLESKYKYRFVEDPREWGYDDESIKTLKLDKKKGKYRIPNPEHSELLNTILKMSSKRAEVDAAESLPGVASVLRQMFTGQPAKPGGTESSRWQRFWGEVTRLGYTEQGAHEKLGVASMKDWLASGRSLEQALERLREPEQRPEPAATSANDIEGEGFHIDLIWLNESQKDLKWTDETMKSFVANQYKVDGRGTLAEVLGRLTREQAEDFVNQINSRREKTASLFE